MIRTAQARFTTDVSEFIEGVSDLNRNFDTLTADERWVKMANVAGAAYNIITRVGRETWMVMRDAAKETKGLSDQMERLEKNSKLARNALGTALIGDVERAENFMRGLSIAIEDVEKSLGSLSVGKPGLLQMLAFMAGAPSGRGGSIIWQMERAGVEERRRELQEYAQLLNFEMMGGAIGPGLTSGNQFPLGWQPPRIEIPSYPRNIPRPDERQMPGSSFDPSDPFAAIGRSLGFEGTSEKVKDLAETIRELIDAIEEHNEQLEEVPKLYGSWGTRAKEAGNIAWKSAVLAITAELELANIKEASLSSVIQNASQMAASEATFRGVLAAGEAALQLARGNILGFKAAMKSVAIFGGLAGLSAVAYSAAGGSFDTRGDLARARAEESGSDVLRAGAGRSTGASARVIAAAASPSVVSFNLTFIYNGPTYYVGPGGMEEFVGEIVPAIQDRLETGQLTVGGRR